MDNNCQNCKYFNNYYVIYQGRLSNCGGHCVHDKIYPHIKKGHFTERNNCNYWEDKSKLIEDRRNTIIGDLRAMKKRLDDIVKILSIDNK